MNPDWIRKAAAVPARQLHLMGAGLLLIAAAACWFYGLRAPLAGLRAVRAEQALLAAGASDPQLLAAQLAVLGTDTQALEKRLGADPAQPSAQLLVGLMGDLAALARDKGVLLHGVTPLPEEATLAFTRIGFNAEVTGSYAGLLAWMSAIERAQPNLSVAGFDMRAAQAPGQVDMTIHIAAYRPQESKP
jgi:Tfp pilus assembly protein PilO